MPSATDAVRERFPELLRSVVKVLTVSDAPDYDQPWQTQGASSATGSGSIVATERGPRVLTNSHVVENQVFIEVRRYGRARKCEAEIEGIGHECDLALLKVEDEDFFEGTTPIALGKLPTLSERVSVLGYPIGGDRLSITQGVVSRIQVTSYAQSQRRLLAAQIDAAINSGNSGGPVIKDGELVGVAFQSLDEGENIGYMIAAPVVEHFLRDLDDGTFDGFPHLGIVAQNLESVAHRKKLGLGGSQGVLVTKVVYQGSAWRHLHEGDVLLEVGGVGVAADGSVRFRKGERLDFGFIVSEHQVGEKLRVKVWRDGNELELELDLRPPAYLVQEDRYELRPSYYIYAGLLFVPLTKDFLKTWGSEWWSAAPRHLMSIYDGDVRTKDRREVVILQKVLADRVNRGYHELDNLEIVRVQGKKVRHLADLVRTIESSDDEYVTFEAADGTQIVVDRASAEKRRKPILRRFGVPRDRSEDLAESK